MAEENEFEWTFEISKHLDPDREEPTKITVYALTYNQAVRKVVALKLPSLDRVADAKEYLSLVNATEIKFTDDVGDTELAPSPDNN